MGRVGTSALLLAVGAFFAFYAWTLMADDYWLSVRGIQTDATVVDYLVGFKSGGEVKLTFHDRAGQVVEAVTDRVWQSPWPKAGDTIRILYDPEDPAGRLRDPRVGDNTVAAMLVSVMALGAGLTGALVAVGALDLSRRTHLWRGFRR